MNYGIGNVKAKGGGNPTITLSASQFSDATNLTFTQAQAEILQNNEVVNVVLPDNSTRTIYKATNDFIGAIVFSQSIQDISSEIGGQMANVLVLCNPSTYEGMVIQAELNGTIANPTLSGNETELTSIGIGSDKYKVGGGKQLYQHNLRLDLGLSGVLLSIINDSSTPFTIATLSAYLTSNSFIDLQSLYPAFGHYRDTSAGADYSVVGIFGYTDTTARIAGAVYQFGVNTQSYKSISTVLADKVIAL